MWRRNISARLRYFNSDGARKGLFYFNLAVFVAVDFMACAPAILATTLVGAHFARIKYFTVQGSDLAFFGYAGARRRQAAKAGHTKKNRKNDTSHGMRKYMY